MLIDDRFVGGKVNEIDLVSNQSEWINHVYHVPCSSRLHLNDCHAVDLKMRMDAMLAVLQESLKR